MKIDLRSIYRFHPIDRGGEKLPVGGDVYYECECGDIVSSVSFVKAVCGCGNIVGGHGAVTIQAAEKVKPLRGKLR